MSVARRARALAVLAVLAAGALPGQEATLPDAEEAAEFARRSASAALHGPQKIFFESLDTDAILRRLLGAPVWGELTDRQKGLLAATARDHFARALASPPGATSEVAWAALPGMPGPPVLVDLGLRYGTSVLKTRWAVRRGPRGWKVEDVVLVDPGLSLAGELGRLLGPEPLRRREGAAEARSRAWPRLAGLAAILAIVLAFGRKLPVERRRLLWLAAAVPALLFAVDGLLAIRRTLSEPFALAEAPSQPWRPFEEAARQAQRDGDAAATRAAWVKALEAGAPRAPVEYQMGLAARSAGEPEAARADFERALADNPPAPGAAKELAVLALAEGRNAEARTLLTRYLREAGPDPDTLSTLAVVESNLGDTPAAVQAIREARSLLPEGWKRAELEAQIYARAGNSAAAIAALRPLAADGHLDRRALRSDPAYLAVATDPGWIAFLDEEPAPTGSTSKAP
jgi:tetratricopeptide (TPR) repeat protein